MIPFNTIYYSTPTSSPGPIKVAAFDLDSTLIKTKSGKLFSGNDSTDWEFNYPNVPTILRDLHHQGYHLVIFTNQRGISSETLQIEHFQAKLQDFVSKLKVPVDVFIATSDDYYRKPCTGMWDKFIELRSTVTTPVALGDSFYCGDAAGRPAKSGSKKDFSSSDLFFAHNIGLEFRLPETVFHGQTQMVLAPPSAHSWPNLNTNITIPTTRPICIMMIGSPASGKSTLAKSLLTDAVLINQDVLKTKAKCLKMFKQAIANGQNIIIDNTNPTVDGRAEYLSLLYDKYCKVVIHMTVDKHLAQHLNCVRVQRGKGAVKKIPDIAFNVYFKKLQEPTLAEGFSAIYHMPFNANINDVPEINYHFVD